MNSSNDVGRRILVVDDEVGVREMLCDALRLSNYDVDSAEDGLDALNKVAKREFDLLIVDVNMPKLDGYAFLKNIREHGNQTPVIMLTARREKQDIAAGFRAGADDYVPKPFGLEELLLRVAAILRRSTRKIEANPVRTCGELSMNLDTYEVFVSGKQVELSPTEFDLLHALVDNKNKVMKRSKLLADVWNINFDTESNVVDTYISYLRKKLGAAGFESIRTVRGIGFQITDKD